MSSALEAYAVSEDRLKQVIGSRDRALADAIIAADAYYFSSVDEIDDESELKAADALRELIDGQPSGNGGGYLYGYALKAICAHIGKSLPEIHDIAGASQWIVEIDRALEAKALPLRLSDLVYGRVPVKIPTPDDYPFIGCWTAPDVQRALAPFREVDLSGVDPEAAETIAHLSADRGGSKRTGKLAGWISLLI